MNSQLRIIFIIFCFSCVSRSDEGGQGETLLQLRHDQSKGTISVFRTDGSGPLLVQQAQEAIRPYIHPINAPDGKGELTEFSPEHHKHQTGLYWGLKQVNGRDYFMNWKDDYWRRVSASVKTEKGAEVKWQTVYDLLDENKTPLMTETQIWSIREEENRFILDLVWEGRAKQDVKMEKFYVGGLFLRMPWRKGVQAEVINAAGQKNGEAEGQRAAWTDVAVQIEGREDMAHMVIMDHPDNNGFPISWRVDNEFGVGPSRQITGDWGISAGNSEVIRYRLIVYTGTRDDVFIRNRWKEYVCESFAYDPENHQSRAQSDY